MLSALADSLYIIYQNRLIVKGFSESFLKKFSSKNAYKLLIEGLAAASAAGQLDYYSKWSYFCQWGFSVFFTNFEGGIWARCMLGIGWAVRPICRGRIFASARVDRLVSDCVGCTGGMNPSPTGL